MPKGIPKNGINKGWFKKGYVNWNKGIKIDRNKYPKFGHFQKHTEETKMKISNLQIGRKWTEENKLKLKDRVPWNKGKQLTEEQKRKISENLKNFNRNNPTFGIKNTIKAHEKLKELVKVGMHPWQKMPFNNKIVKPTKPEIKLYIFIKKIFENAILNYKISEIRRICDIAIPNLKIDIEYDEPYWHDKNEDKQRDFEFQKIGWRVIRFTPEILEVI